MVCREVRRRYTDSVLPAIFVSSNSRPEHIVDGLAAGAQDYMTKPVNKSELIARVQSHLSSSRKVLPSRNTCAGTTAGLLFTVAPESL